MLGQGTPSWDLKVSSIEFSMQTCEISMSSSSRALSISQVDERPPLRKISLIKSEAEIWMQGVNLQQPKTYIRSAHLNYSI